MRGFSCQAPPRARRAAVVSRRTADGDPTGYTRRMILKAFSYLMIGVFASGLVMALVGAAGVLSGL